MPSYPRVCAWTGQELGVASSASCEELRPAWSLTHQTCRGTSRSKPILDVDRRRRRGHVNHSRGSRVTSSSVLWKVERRSGNARARAGIQPLENPCTPLPAAPCLPGRQRTGSARLGVLSFNDADTEAGQGGRAGCRERRARNWAHTV